MPLAQLIPDITSAAERVNVIAANDLEYIKEIGVGGFAVVFKGSSAKRTRNSIPLNAYYGTGQHDGVDLEMTKSIWWQ